MRFELCKLTYIGPYIGSPGAANLGPYCKLVPIKRLRAKKCVRHMLILTDEKYFQTVAQVQKFNFLNHVGARHCLKPLGQRKGLNISTTVGFTKFPASVQILSKYF